MILAIAILIAISIGALLLWVFRVNVVPSGLVRQLQTFPTHGEITASDPIRRRQRQESSEKLKAILAHMAFYPNEGAVIGTAPELNLDIGVGEDQIRGSAIERD